MRAADSFPEVYLYTGSADMRHGIDRLVARIEMDLGRGVTGGGLYVFVSRSRKKIRCLYWDCDGYAMWLKRLEAGTFQIRAEDGYEEISGVDLEQLLSGMNLSRIKLRRSVKENCYS